MNTRDIRITIAESIGWRYLEGGMWHHPDGSTVPETLIPDYCNDLNAMHEVWCTLIRNQHYIFRSYLQTIVLNAKESGVLPIGPAHSVSNATALQRAEAYLRTIGKWNEKD